MTANQSAVVTIPRALTSREQTRSLVRGSARPGTTHLVLNALAETFVAPSAAAELVTQILEVGVEHVVAVNATPHFEKLLKDEHQRQTAPGERTFLLTFQNHDASVLLRKV